MQKQTISARKILLVAISMCICFGGITVSGCRYTPKYTADECKSPINSSCDSEKYSFKPEYSTLNFNRKIQEKGISFYYEEKTKAKKIDYAIDSLKLIQDAVCDVPSVVYLVDDISTHINDDGFWINVNDSPELVGAVLLESKADQELPFGIFAGVSANLLSENIEFKKYSDNQLNSDYQQYLYVSELQYPLYLRDTASEKERTIAWNFAYRLGEKWLKRYTVEELINVSLEDIAAFLSENEIVLPSYYFPVGDFFYKIQIETNNLHYYFSYDYDDCEFSEDEFALEYTVLRDFINENEKFIDEVSMLYEYEGFPEPVDCFFGSVDEFHQAPTIGQSYFSRNAIVCYTVGTFGHEIFHYITYHADAYGYILEEYMAAFFAIRYSSYAQKVEYLDYAHVTKNRYRGGSYTEEDLKFLKKTSMLYDETFGKSNIFNFDAEQWLLCISYFRNQEYPGITILGQGASFCQYIYDIYGFKTLMEISRTYPSVEIEGKNFDDFKNEWRIWVNSYFF